jgi:hypothetical protein
MVQNGNGWLAYVDNGITLPGETNILRESRVFGDPKAVRLDIFSLAQAYHDSNARLMSRSLFG